MHPEVVELLERNEDHARRFRTRFDHVQDGQHPDAVTVCCSDSRVLQDRMWGNDEPGHLFTCGNIGNRVVQRTDAGEAVSGDVLYPLLHAGTEVAVVVGHTGCGAITATYDAITNGGDHAPGVAHCIELLRPHLEPGVESLPADVQRAAAVNRLVEYNVDRQIDHLLASDDVPDSTALVGVVYDFQDVYPGDRGEVHVVNVQGETDVDELRRVHPEVASRIDRLWEY